jgi:predicted small lipoprotein YifL
VKRALALVAVLALAGCGERGTADPPRPRPPAPPGDQRADTVQQGAEESDAIASLLARRAAALQAGDARALAATSAYVTQRVADRRAARRARRLPLRDVAYEVEEEERTADRARIRVRSSYRIAGVSGRQGARRVLELRLAEGRWRVVRESTRAERHPWEIAAFTARSTGRFVVLAPPGIDAGLVGATLERARQAAARRLPAARSKRRLLVVVAADAAQARALTARIRGVERLAAITDAEVRTRPPAQRVVAVVSLRLLVPWARFASLGAAGRERVVAHELTHAALVSRTSGRTPSWLQEAIALYASRDDRSADAAVALGRGVLAPTVARRALSLRALSTRDAIARLDGDAVAAAYAYASAAGFHLARRHGPRALRRVYAAFNDEAFEGDAGPGITDRVLRAELGVSLRRFERELRESLLLGLYAR